MPLDPLTPEKRRRQTRDHLLEAAAQVFAERGFHGASLDEVAAVAGFTKGAVYSNFKNKEDLFLAVLERIHSHEMDEIHRTLDASEVPPESRLSDFVALMRDPQAQTPGTWSALYLEFCVYALRNPEARRRLVQLDEAVMGWLADLIVAERAKREIVTDEPAGHVARFVEAFSRGVGIMRALDPDAIDEKFLETAIALIARAVVPTEPPAQPGPYDKEGIAQPGRPRLA
jgi:AcrR family transcriptional regulator